MTKILCSFLMLVMIAMSGLAMESIGRIDQSWIPSVRALNGW